MSKSYSITAIGAGNIASHLVPALKEIGCDIVEVYSRSIYKARSLASKVNAKPRSDLSKINKESDIYLIMIADDAIKEVVDKLPQFNDQQMIVHTSGATPSTVLKSTQIPYGVFYPLQSFKKGQEINLSQVPFLIFSEDEKLLRTIGVIARQLSQTVKVVTDQERLLYHLAAVFVNNFTNHIACIGDNILNNNKLDPQILKPIIETTFNKILTQDACAIQTGPAIRNDVALQKKHLKLIENEIDWTSIYKIISKSIYNSNKEE